MQFKFRGMDPKSGKFVFGTSLEQKVDPESGKLLAASIDGTTIATVSLGLCLGVVDKNGVEVCEHDLVQLEDGTLLLLTSKEDDFMHLVKQLHLLLESGQAFEVIGKVVM